jgi:hypothetical protein
VTKKPIKAPHSLFPSCPRCGDARAKKVLVEYPDRIERQHRGLICYIEGGTDWVVQEFNCGLILKYENWPDRTATEVRPCGTRMRGGLTRGDG